GSYVGRAAGRSRGTWRISLELICAFSAILERAFEPGREGHPPPMLPPRHVAGRYPVERATIPRCYRRATSPGATNNGCGRCADEGTIDAPERAFLAFRRKEEGER